MPPPATALHPCDWVHTAEAAAILGAPSAEADPTSDEAGSVTPFCVYNAGNDNVTSELYLPGSFPVDAAAEFTMGRGADERSADVDGLAGPAHCVTAPRDMGPLRTLTVLLPGDRLYSVDGLHLACNTLTRFAQTAIARISP